MVLRLNTAPNARRTLARIIRLYDTGELAEQKYRALIYGLSHLLAFFKHEDDLRIEERISRIEEAIQGGAR
jgi:hypothetical protein